LLPHTYTIDEKNEKQKAKQKTYLLVDYFCTFLVAFVATHTCDERKWNL
jgi:hypothetical protein